MGHRRDVADSGGILGQLFSSLARGEGGNPCRSCTTSSAEAHREPFGSNFHVRTVAVAPTRPKCGMRGMQWHAERLEGDAPEIRKKVQAVLTSSPRGPQSSQCRIGRLGSFPYFFFTSSSGSFSQLSPPSPFCALRTKVSPVFRANVCPVFPTRGQVRFSLARPSPAPINSDPAIRFMILSNRGVLTASAARPASLP